MKNLNRVFLLLALFLTTVNALDKIYFLPKEANTAEKHIIKLIQNANKRIDIAMYNLSYKKFVKELKKISKKDVTVTIINGKSETKFYKKIKLIQSKIKQHIKLAIIDNKYVIYGSANWKKESFDGNYEIINITDDKNRVKQFDKIFKELNKIDEK